MKPKNIAPDIFRQRLLIEGFWTVEVNETSIKEYLLGLAAHLDLRTYGDPIIFSPSSGMGKEENAGYDAFVPLIDSGISAYFWSKRKFLSVVIYTCKGFDEEAAIAFTKEFFKTAGETVDFGF
jgi:S-adenosylmethionine decarboxylase